MGKYTLNGLSGEGDKYETCFVCLWPPEQWLKAWKVQKKIFSHSYEIMEHTDKKKNKQTNRQLD